MLSDLISKVVTAFFSRGLGALLGLIITIALPQIISLTEVGQLYFYMSQAALVSILIKFGLDYNLNSQLLTAKSETDVEIRLSLDMNSLAFMFFVVLIFGLIAAYFYSKQEAILIPLFWGGLLALNYYFFQLCKFKGEILKASFYRSIINVLSLLCALIILYLLPMNGGSYQLILIHLALLFVLTLFTFNSIIPFKVIQKRSYTDVYTNIIGNKKFFFYTCLLFLLSDIDLWFIKLYLEDDELAVYATCKRLSLILAIVIDLANLVIPNFYRKAFLDETLSKDVYTLSRRVSFACVLFSLILVCLTYFFGQQVIVLIFDSELVNARSILLCFIISFTFNLLFGFNEVFLTLKGDKDILYKALFITVLILILLNAILVHQFGLYGAVWSFLIANFFYRVSLFIYVRNRYNVSLMASLV